MGVYAHNMAININESGTLKEIGGGGTGNVYVQTLDQTGTGFKPNSYTVKTASSLPTVTSSSLFYFTGGNPNDYYRIYGVVNIPFVPNLVLILIWPLGNLAAFRRYNDISWSNSPQEDSGFWTIDQNRDYMSSSNKDPGTRQTPLVIINPNDAMWNTREIHSITYSSYARSTNLNVGSDATSGNAPVPLCIKSSANFKKFEFAVWIANDQGSNYIQKKVSLIAFGN